MTKKTVKVKKKHFNFKKFIILCLFFYVLFYAIYCIFSGPIKHIKVVGNEFLSDREIIRVAKLDTYPSIFKYLSSTIEKRIEKMDLISEVKVKKQWGYVVRIEVKENKPLFYNMTNDKVYLSDGKIISNEDKVYGIPSLGNYVKDEILMTFINKFKEINSDILYEINSIYYDPSYNELGEVIDSERFRLVMEDGNQVYLTSAKAEKINYYNEIYASVNDKKGYLYLDSGDYGNFGFIPFGSE